MRRSIVLSGVIFAALTGSLAMAGNPHPKEAERYKSDADRYAKQAEGNKTQADQATGDLKTAYQALADASKALADIDTKLAAAAESGDDAAARALMTQAMPQMDAVNHASDLISVRRNQAMMNARLTDSEQDAYLKSIPDANKPLGTDVINARKKVVEALDKLAVLLSTPGSNVDATEDARDVSQQAADTLEIAQATLQIANEHASLMSRQGVSDPSVAAGIAQLTKLEQDYLAAMKNAKEQALTAHQLQRKLQAQKNDIIRNLPAPTRGAGGGGARTPEGGSRTPEGGSRTPQTGPPRAADPGAGGTR